MPTATVKAFAKINLGLKVLGIRDDGFHELRTIYQSISLHDVVEVTLSKRTGRPQVKLTLTGISVPLDSDNLAVRAASAICEASAVKRLVGIRLTKRVPTGAGMGGGSSDAAAVIRALHLLSSKRLPVHEVFQIAAAIGSDVPFFLFGGRAVGVGRGEEVYPLSDGPAFHCVIALPEEGMSTAEAYKGLGAGKWPATGKRNESQASGHPVPQTAVDTFCAPLLDELNPQGRGGFTVVPNDFEKLLFDKFPHLAKAKRMMMRCGCVHASLTGSGSAVYGLFSTSEQAAAAHERLKSFGMRLYLARTVGRRQYAQGVRLS